MHIISALIPAHGLQCLEINSVSPEHTDHSGISREMSGLYGKAGIFFNNSLVWMRLDHWIIRFSPDESPSFSDFIQN